MRACCVSGDFIFDFLRPSSSRIASNSLQPNFKAFPFPIFHGKCHEGHALFFFLFLASWISILKLFRFFFYRALLDIEVISRVELHSFAFMSVFLLSCLVSRQQCSVWLSIKCGNELRIIVKDYFFCVCLLLKNIRFLQISWLGCLNYLKIE